MRLILSRIYSFFQQKTYKKITSGRKKSVEAAKTSLNLEKKLFSSSKTKFLFEKKIGKVAKFHEIWMNY